MGVKAMHHLCLLHGILLLIICGVSSYTVKENGWRKLSTKPGFGAFDSKDRAFDVSVSLANCRSKRTLTVNKRPGVDDYHEIIQDKLNKLDKEGGGVLRLGEGTFTVGKQLRVGSFTCVFGQGMSKTTIKMKNFSKPFRTSGVVRSFQTTNVTIMDLTIDGNRKNQYAFSKADRYGRYGFFSELTNFLHMRRIHVKNNLGYGFDPHGSKRHWAYYLVIEDCRASNNGLDGFTLDQTIFVSLLRSKAYGNGRHGVNVVTGTRYCLLKYNRAKGNGMTSGVGCGYAAQNNQDFGTRNVTLYKNVAKYNRKGGICMNDVEYGKIVKNRVQNSKSPCYVFTRVKNAYVKHNQCDTRGGRFRLYGKNVYKEYGSTGQSGPVNRRGSSKSLKKKGKCKKKNKKRCRRKERKKRKGKKSKKRKKNKTTQRNSIFVALS